MKTCTKCKVARPTLDFAPLGNGRLHSWCRGCQRAAAAAYQKTPVGRARAAARQRAHYHRAKLAVGDVPELRVEAGTTEGASKMPLFAGDTLIGFIDPEYVGLFQASRKTGK